MKKQVLIVAATSLLLSFASCYGEDVDGLVVKVSEGLIKGKYMATKRGRTFRGFIGIPYAEPPIGPLRFAAPVPKKPWDGVKETSKWHNVCPQRDIYRRTDLIEGDEDCLYLNVYTPKLNDSADQPPLPVMLFVHGGGFLAGSAVGYQPEIMLDRQVVLVVVNYRLGALGFLTTGDTVVPGNNGLKDQRLAIAWTGKNALAFGGDPQRITLFGESAGGASVHFHMLSPMSRGLFHAGISQSGTALCAWAFAPEGEGVAHARKLARIFHCPADDSVAMVDCLRRVDASAIIAQDRKFMKWDTDPMIPFKPCAEPEHAGAFLARRPADVTRSGGAARVPWMTGINADDGALRAAALLANPYLLGDVDDEFERVVPIALLYDKVVDAADDVRAITRKLKRFYFDDGRVTNASKQGVIDMFTDGWFMAAAHQSLRHHLKHVRTPAYYYLFGYRGTTSLTAIFGDRVNDYGVCHADELQYQFPIADALFPEKMQTPRDEAMAELLTTLWTNFATTLGDPTPTIDDVVRTKWDPVASADEMEYYRIDAPGDGGTRMSRGLYAERDRLWRDILATDVGEELRDEL